jgi:hypothetical protein
MDRERGRDKNGGRWTNTDLKKELANQRGWRSEEVGGKGSEKGWIERGGVLERRVQRGEGD